MSNSLNPWILQFLLDVANQFGAKLFDCKPYQKKKKVQIVEFLTYPPENQDTFIWARISDKKSIATVKFTKQAVTNCHARLQGKPRLIQYKGAIATISNFKPICSRFPLEHNRMSSEEFIIFECDHVEILGSAGEATFGQPKAIEQDPDISLWSKGLAQGGGAGNVLKEKIQPNSLNDKILPPMPSPPTPSPRPPPLPRTVTNQPAFTRINDDDLKSYKATWHFLEKDRLRFIDPEEITPKIQRQGSEMEQERSRSATPISNWEHSPRAKAIDAEHSELIKLPTVSSSLPPPTPAQRVPASSASLNVVNETQISPDTRPLSMARKVPRPASPEPPAPEQSGEGRVLVPNSDTSQSQSQSMKRRQILLGGNVVDTTEPLPWITMGEVCRIMSLTAELRLRNNVQ